MPDEQKVDWVAQIIAIAIILFFLWLCYRIVKWIFSKIFRKKSKSITLNTKEEQSIDAPAIPEFNFKNSRQHKRKWDEIKAEQDAMKAAGSATYADVEWVVGIEKNADRLGERMMNALSSIILLAFDKECDILIRDVTFRNLDSFMSKIRKSFDRLNKYGETYRIFITEEYLNLKYQELRIAFDYENKLQLEKEEQRLLREEMAEQRKVEMEAIRLQRQAEKERKEAEQEIKRYQEMLALDRSNKELQRLLEKAQQDLAQAIEDSKRAISQAQLTKKGVVYIISNIGSFGENIYKIGMTRRLEPEDRVRELGDASVPFPFDIHALIRTDDAPKLESDLHRKFAHCQVNRVNTKKEFFEVELKEIVKAAEQLGAEVNVTMIAEASEYRQSLEMKKKNKYNDIEESYDEDLDEEEVMNV